MHRLIGVAAAISVGLGCAACGGSTTSMPSNVSTFLFSAYTGANGGTSAPVAQRVEDSVGVSGYQATTTLPGTVSFTAPNAAGAVLLTWKLNGRRFQWWISWDGDYATPENTRSAAAIGAS
jgi:hypothetical protein